MKDWITLFEKYRIDRRLLDLHRGEFACLRDDSPRRETLSADIARLERAVLLPELLLSRYDEQVASPREAVRRADERLFLACHYIKGLTMEETAAEMHVSRDTVYRIRRRILSRGPIPEIDEAELERQIRDARDGVNCPDSLHAACFVASTSPRAENPPAREPSAVKERGYPDFIFSAK